MNAESRLGWGILGTGNIARKFAEAVKVSQTGTLVAVGSRNQATADSFGETFAIPQRYASYAAVLADPKVQAVYISMPNQLHAEWAIKAAEAGKHILCEKPLALNYPEAMAIVEAAQAHKVFLMEAFMYRCHPLMAKLSELLKAKVIGELRLIQANFCFNMGEKFDNIRLQNECGGGSIMDLGCYTVSVSRLAAGAALGGDPIDPIEVKGSGYIGARSRVDEWACGVLTFPKGIIASFTAANQVSLPGGLRLYGSAGSIEVPNPFFANPSKLIVNRAGVKEPEVVEVAEARGLYTVEADVVAAAVAAGRQEAAPPCMTWADSLANMKVLDAWRKQCGLVFDGEKEEALKQTVTKRPLRPRAKHNMVYGQVPGISKPISKFLMGTMIYQPDQMNFASAMFDHFIEIGGNAFDTAYVYGGGRCEQALGKWLKLRGNRNEVVLLGKGGHTPACYPEAIDKQLKETLERLQTDYLDIYLLHRDNLDLPVGELVDCLNRHVKAGRVKVIGGSNWTLARLAEANEYAKKHGLTPMGASSNHFSLAHWNEAVWGGCLAIVDQESRAWHTKTQMPNFSWSSQAQGFFTGRYSPQDTSNASMVRVWYNQGNWERLARARQLAAKKGTTATAIATAYVLQQAWPQFALIGPQSLLETASSAEGLAVKLSEDEKRWLNLES